MTKDEYIRKDLRHRFDDADGFDTVLLIEQAMDFEYFDLADEMRADMKLDIDSRLDEDRERRIMSGF